MAVLRVKIHLKNKIKIRHLYSEIKRQEVNGSWLFLFNYYLKTCYALLCISISINKEYLLNMYDKLPTIFKSCAL